MCVLDPFIVGGGQESGSRAGTENVLLIAGMGKAAEVVEEEAINLYTHMTRCTDIIREVLTQAFDKVSANKLGSMKL